MKATNMSIKSLTRALFPILGAVVALGLVFPLVQAAGTPAMTGGWAWGTSVGWINFTPSGGGVSVCPDHLEGYAWSENVGWIRLGTMSGCATHTYSNSSSTDYGVNKAVSGTLSGYAWSTNAGWIKFDPTFGGVTIDPVTGSFDGYAWSENGGWIHLKGTGPVPYNVIAGIGKLFLPLIRR